nr:MAG TPA: hypothetical protein [Caudoviricetes sp.]
MVFLFFSYFYFLKISIFSFLSVGVKIVSHFLPPTLSLSRSVGLPVGPDPLGSL